MTNRKFALALAGVLGIAGVRPAPASAQAWIGQMVGTMIAQEEAYRREMACRHGVPMSEKEVAEARTPALAAMNGYWQAAKAGGSFAAQFHLDKRAEWSGGGLVAKGEQVGGQADPFAKAGLTLDQEPLGFVRAGDGSTAEGQWVVRDAAGAPRGTYTAVFKRKLGVWRLSTLMLSTANEYAEPVVQYCHVPQDVLGYRLDSSAADIARLERAVPKAEQKLAKEEKDLAKMREKAAAASRSDVDRVALNDEVARNKRLATQLEAMRKALADAQDEHANALADAKARDDARAEALRGTHASG